MTHTVDECQGCAWVSGLSHPSSLNENVMLQKFQCLIKSCDLYPASNSEDDEVSIEFIPVNLMEYIILR